MDFVMIHNLQTGTVSIWEKGKWEAYRNTQIDALNRIYDAEMPKVIARLKQLFPEPKEE